MVKRMKQNTKCSETETLWRLWIDMDESEKYRCCRMSMKQVINEIELYGWGWSIFPNLMSFIAQP